jgi:hypothetical protein
LKLTIEKVDNGFLILGHDEGDTYAEVFEEPENRVQSPDPGTVRRLLWAIQEYVGAYGSDHDAERVRVIVEKKGVDYND